MKTVYKIGKHSFNNANPVDCVFVDDKPYKIRTAKDGSKYFEIKNPYIQITEDSSFEDLMTSVFYGRIYDAIKAVRDGYAHCLYLSASPIGRNISLTHPTPIVLLDEEKGKQYRLRTIEGFKDAKFGYTITFGNKKSLNGFEVLSNNGNIMGWPNSENISAFYDTEKEAKNQVTKYIESAKTLIENKTKSELLNVCSYDNTDIAYVVKRLAIDAFYKGVDHMLDNYDFEVIQSIDNSEK